MFQKTDSAQKPYSRRSLNKSHITLSLTEEIVKWIQDTSADRGLTCSSFVEGILRDERERRLNPPPHVLLTHNPETGAIEALKYRNV